MRTKHLFDLTFAALACLAFAACGDKPKDDKHDDQGHEHKAPHEGGEILELDGGKAHLELIHDHDGGNVTVYVYGAEFDQLLYVEKPVIMAKKGDVTADVPLTAVDAKPDGTAHSWKGGHDVLKTDPWDGRIRVKIGGKEHQSALEGAPHTHK